MKTLLEPPPLYKKKPPRKRRGERTDATQPLSVLPRLFVDDPALSWRVKMYGPPPATAVGAMVSPERALEHMSVEKAWSLLDTLSSQVVGKQTELQVGAAT